jgi:integrase
MWVTPRLRSKTPTVETFLSDWLVQSVPARNRYRTQQGYTQIVRDYLIPHLGRYRLDALEPKHVQVMLNAIASERAPRTVRNVRAALRRALNVAIRDGYLTRNVAKLVDVPQADKPRIRTLTADEARQLLAAIEDHRLKALYWTALLLGLREGELCGLRIDDLDLEAGTLSSTYAVQRQQGKLRHDLRLKTEESRRSLPLPSVLRGILKEHLARLKEAQAFYKWQEHGLLFPSERGTPLEPRNLFRHFKAVLAGAATCQSPSRYLRISGGHSNDDCTLQHPSEPTRNAG